MVAMGRASLWVRPLYLVVTIIDDRAGIVTSLTAYSALVIICANVIFLDVES
jgi:hypothetical protein